MNAPEQMAAAMDQQEKDALPLDAIMANLQWIATHSADGLRHQTRFEVGTMLALVREVKRLQQVTEGLNQRLAATADAPSTSGERCRHYEEALRHLADKGMARHDWQFAEFVLGGMTPQQASEAVWHHVI